MAAATVTRRLAGIAFEAEPPPSPDVLPRMDVAGFVGFAAAGPVNVPVPVEDSTSYGAVFGGDAPLAWDPARGEQKIAQLGPAVRAFFRNGGRRAWIVRVTGPAAQRTLFPVPNLVANGYGRLTAAVLPARAVGSWSDGLRVETALTSRPATVVTASTTRLQFRLEVPSGDTIVPGDLLRVRMDKYELLVAVASVEPAPVVRSATQPGRTVFKVTCLRRSALWLERVPPVFIGLSGSARLVGVDGRGHSATATVTGKSTADRVELEVNAAAPLAPALGSLLSVTGLGAGALRELFLVVRDVRPSGSGFLLAGDPYWVRQSAPTPHPTLAAGTAVERMTFELRADLDGAEHWSLTGLGLAPGHPRYVGDLPTDEELYALHDGEVDPPPPPALWTEAASPRFPLAGRDFRSSDIVYYPLGMEASFGAALGAERLPGTALGRDGLTRFDDSLFLDPDLRSNRVDTVLATAEYVRWQSATPRPLTGIHALLGLDEVTLVAVPDAIQPAWRRTRRQPLPTPPASDPAPAPEGDRFERCSWRVLTAPGLTHTQPDENGSFSLTWDPSDEPKASYVLEESTEPADWTTARAVYEGPATHLDLYARPHGTYLYRVRVEAGGNISNWSPGVVVRVDASTGWQTRADSAYAPGTLLAVQRSLLRMCAARGDLLAVLSAPEHYRDDAAVAHADALRAAADTFTAGAPAAAPRGLDPVAPLDGSESAALAYGALYHPWLTGSLPETPEQFVRTPPDGSALGVLADRAATRGAWVAPANVVLKDVVTLEPAVPRNALGALLQAQVNEVRQEPDGFLWLSADTLALDPDLRPVNVRRLIALLRRLALLRGVDYVFEPNNDLFRRGIQRGFEATMTELYVLGAFAGATPDEAFRVEVGSPPNTQETLEAGQLIVDLKFAPSRPLTFLTVRLVGDAERTFVVETR